MTKARRREFASNVWFWTGWHVSNAQAYSDQRHAKAAEILRRIAEELGTKDGRKAAALVEDAYRIESGHRSPGFMMVLELLFRQVGFSFFPNTAGDLASEAIERLHEFVATGLYPHAQDESPEVWTGGEWKRVDRNKE